MAQPFYLGLNMSGTVSAGAYTAGVMDFLIEAMDAWYAERDRQIQQFGNDYERWTIPPHELQLAVMAGASGGGITSALTSAALCQAFHSIHDQSPSSGASTNVLFKSWVADIDLKPLLGHADLDSHPGHVVSVLDSTIIRTIASNALNIPEPLAARRPWVRDGLKVVLTVTNLRGTPYAVEPQTDSESARTIYFADRQQFEVLWDAQPSGGETVPLPAKGGAAWSRLGEAAVATSAFPVVLAPQTLNRTAGEYNERRWQIDQADPKCGPEGNCVCQTNEPMRPAWNLADTDPVQTLNVDGGATNNSPFDCARLELARLEPVNASGHNQRDPKLADRAVISIAPLLNEIGGLPTLPASDLLAVLSRFVDVLVNQSRIQGENLKLTSETGVASRWVIAPTPAISGTEPIAGALLSAFGGFVSRLFREHDYQLGRRNCQRFLMHYFGVPWDNVVAKQYNLSAEARQRLNAPFGFAAEGEPTQLFALIPVVGQLRDPVAAIRKPINRQDLEGLADLAVDRLKRVGKDLLGESGAGGFSDFAFDAAWLLIKGKLRGAILTYAATGLATEGFLT